MYYWLFYGWLLLNKDIYSTKEIKETMKQLRN